MHEVVEDPPIFQIIRQEGLLPGLRRTVVRVVDKRFPALIALAQQQVEQMESEEILNDVLMKIIMAQSQEEAQEILLHWQENIQ